ncbi:MAG: type III-B CRISPR module RAMP protein Cmr4 [Candidatus Lokiarchaeota archaeon]|nr:type III-B CRISPR module RAMP protein Cmr4 [Candidatus Harpocratesius repetitus]
MYKIARPFFMLVETPLHAGSGTELGIIDLPIQRERHTGFPKIESSGLKGSIRKAFEELNLNNSDISLIFGPEEGNAHAGALGFTDARLLLFPVKSMKKIFAWITCPKVLERFVLDLKLAKINDFPEIPPENSVSQENQLIIKDEKIVLEEYTFTIRKNEACSKMAKWISKHVIPNENEYNYLRDKLEKDIVVLPDDDFRDFVTLSTEIITRTKINNETGTVNSGALFTEEYLPTESILYSLSLATPIFNKNKGSFSIKKGKDQKEMAKEEENVMNYFNDNIPKVIQIGGNATTGKGIVRITKWM